MKKFNLMDYTGEALEELIFSDDVILEKGTSFEAYSNLIDGVSDEESSEGQSMFFHITEDLTFGEILTQLALDGMGSVRKEELTIRIIQENEEVELSFAKENELKVNKGFEVQYTQEMEEQDLLWEEEKEDTEKMKELQESIINEAKEQGWNGYAYLYTHENESIVELYPSKDFYQRAANGENGYDGEGKYTGNCRSLIKNFNEIFQGKAW